MNAASPPGRDPSGPAYHRPASVQEALEMASRLGPGAVFLAGGTELLPDMRRGQARVSDLISLRGVSGLDAIEVADGQLSLGAKVTHEALRRSPHVAEHCPALADAAALLGAVQIRHQGTIGGNFCGAVPCADTPPAALAAGAVLDVVGPGGSRQIPLDQFFLGPRKQALEPGELLLSIGIPLSSACSGSAFERFTLRKGLALPVAAVAVWLELEGDRIPQARVALGAVAPVPLLAPSASEALGGSTISDQTIEAAADAAVEDALPISDIRGSADYRLDIVRVLTNRAIRAAVERAQGGRP